MGKFSTEEYVAHNLGVDPRVVNTNHAKSNSLRIAPYGPAFCFSGLQPDAQTLAKMGIEKMRIDRISTLAGSDASWKCSRGNMGTGIKQYILILLHDHCK